jgi:hypothetical protein
MIGNFNINILTNTIESTTLQILWINIYLIIFIKSTTPNNTQINHIWINAPTQQCDVGSTQAYWTKHNPMYLAFNYKVLFLNLLCHPFFLIKKLHYINVKHLHYLFFNP